MPTTLPPSTDYTGAGVTQGGKKTFIAAMRQFLAEAFGTTSSIAGVRAQLGVDFPVVEWTVAGNDLTVAVKTALNADASAANPLPIPFRNATLTTADNTVLSLTAGQSIVIPNGATMGANANEAFKLWAVEFNDGGTARIGVVNARSGLEVMSIRPDDIADSTAVSTGADSAQVFYTPTAGVTAKPYKILGCAEWQSGLSSPGVWASGPTRKQNYYPGLPLPGDIVQVRRTEYSAVAVVNSGIPLDNTVPQNTEGVQVMSRAITAKSAANLFRINSQGVLSGPQSGTPMHAAALFQDSVANAIAAFNGYFGLSTFNAVSNFAFSKLMLAATVSATTFKVRYGTTAGTAYFNGDPANTGGIFNGVACSYLEVQEICG